jgi:excisionase family DNA binding protein
VASTEFLFIEEVAELTRVPVSCVQFWIRTGKLPSLKPGRRVLVRKAALERFLAESERNVKPAEQGGDSA